MNQMSGETSERSGPFPAVLQHDTVLRPRDCGGPLVTTDGKVIGINIARAGRVESYAIPADVVRAQLEDLRTGKRRGPTEMPITVDPSAATLPSP